MLKKHLSIIRQKESHHTRYDGNVRLLLIYHRRLGFVGRCNRRAHLLRFDCYGQPTGDVIEKEMTRIEAMDEPYCYEDYQTALVRALD